MTVPQLTLWESITNCLEANIALHDAFKAKKHEWVYPVECFKLSVDGIAPNGEKYAIKIGQIFQYFQTASEAAHFFATIIYNKHNLMFFYEAVDAGKFEGVDNRDDTNRMSTGEFNALVKKFQKEYLKEFCSYDFAEPKALELIKELRK